MKMNVRLLVAACLSFVSAGGCDCIGGVNGTLKPPEFDTADRVTNRAKFTLAGTKQPNTSVTLQRGDDKPFEAVALDAAADFSVVVDLKEGPNPFFGVAVDEAGRTSDPAGPVTITLDSVPPGAPRFDPIETSVVVDNGASSVDVVVTGTRDADCELQVLLDRTPLSRTALTLSGDGFSFPVAVPVGDIVVTATCVDDATNQSEPATLTLTGAYDETPPALPTVEPVDNPIVIGDDETEAVVTLRGTREPESAITIDDVEVVAIAASTSWSTDRTFALGSTTIAVRAVDRAENVSEAVAVDVDVRRLPRAPVASPPSLTNQPTLALAGFCGAGTAVGVAFDVDEPAGLFDALPPCVDGGFTLDIPLTEGPNAFYLYAVDDVGLESVRVGPFSTELDTVAPAAPVLTFPSCAATGSCNVFIEFGRTTGPLNLAGTRAEGDAAITVDGVRTVEPGSAEWATSITATLAQTRAVTFRSIDAAGNESEPVLLSVTGIAGLALPTVECIGPYKISGTNAACPLELPEIRRAVRGDAVTLRGRKSAGSGVRIRNLTTNGEATLPESQGLTWTLTVTGLVADRQTLAVSVFNAESASAEIGPFAVRRDDTAPAAPTVEGLVEFNGTDAEDAILSVDGTATTRASQARVAGLKDLDGDVCVAQVVVNEQTCPGGECPDTVFSDCFPVAAADGLTDWGCATAALTCEPNLGLQPGLNRLCFESSDVVPADGEALNPSDLARVFAGNRSVRTCIDIDRTIDPVPSFVRPVDGTLVRPGPLRVDIAIDQPVDLTDAVRVCVGAGDAGCAVATEVQTDLWQATVTIPAGAAGTAITLRADALSNDVVRGSATITTTLLPGNLLLTDLSATRGSGGQGQEGEACTRDSDCEAPLVCDRVSDVCTHRTVGGFAPQVAVGPNQETIVVWRDECWLEEGCPVRDTNGTLSAANPADVFLRVFADGQLSRTVNLSDEKDPITTVAVDGNSRSASIAVAATGEIHVAWIDDGYDLPNICKTYDVEGVPTSLCFPQVGIVYRNIGNDGRTCTIDANCGPSALCFDGQCRPVSSADLSLVEADQLSGDPALAAASTGELVAVWWNSTDPSPDFKDSAYMKIGVYCSADCIYDNGNVQIANTWETADITPQQRGLILSNPAVVADESRNAWVAWHEQRCIGPADDNALRCDTVGNFALRFTRVPLDRNTGRVADPPIEIAVADLDSASAPELAWDPAGYVHIVWSTSTSVRYRRFDTNAGDQVDPLSPEQILYTGPVGGVSVATLEANTVVVGWAPALGDCPVDPTEQGLQSVVVLDGIPATTTVVTPGIGISSPSMAALAGGAVAVVYEDEGEEICLGVRNEFRPDLRFDVITPQ